MSKIFNYCFIIAYFECPNKQKALKKQQLSTVKVIHRYFEKKPKIWHYKIVRVIDCPK